MRIKVSGVSRVQGLDYFGKLPESQRYTLNTDPKEA